MTQLKIIDGQLFFNDIQLNGIQKFDIQSDGGITYLKLEMVVESLLDNLDIRYKFREKSNKLRDDLISTSDLPKNIRLKLNQLKIVDGKLFLDNEEIEGIKKINLQK
ncbi:MAG: hypothetical protein IKF82_05235 [Bacilli bacterium]|nr:hypothetical protein [Bacilli bacterium]